MRQPFDTDNLIRVSPSATPAGAVNASADPEFNALAIAPIPPVLGTDVDISRQFYRSAVSQLRMPPLPSQAKPAAGAVAQSSSILITQVVSPGSGGSGTAGILLSVNNATSPIQNALNLTGPGVVYGPGKGEVQISGNYQSIQQNGVTRPFELILNFLPPITVTDNPGNGSTDIAVPVFVGSGASHAIGLVPDPGVSAGITRFVCEDGTFRIPPGTGGAAEYQTVQTAGTPVTQQPVLNFLSPFIVTNNGGNTSTDIAITLTPVIQVLTTSFLTSGDLSVSANTLTKIADLTQILTMPASGGPFRVRYSYSVNWHNVANGPSPVDTYVTDGILIYPSVITSPSSGGPNYWNNTQSFTTTGTYANGATVTFDVYVIGASTMTFTVKQNSIITSNPSTYLETEIVSSS